MGSPFIYLVFVMMFISLLMLLYNKGNFKVNRFLMGALFCTNVHAVIIYCYLFCHSPLLTGYIVPLLYPFFFLIGPLFYLYVRAILLKNAKLKTFDYLHFILFGVCIIGAVPFNLSSREVMYHLGKQIIFGSWDLTNYRINKIIPHHVNQVLVPIQSFCYLVLTCIQLLKRFRESTGFFKQRNHYNLTNIWLILSISIYSVFTLIYDLGMVQYFDIESGGRSQYFKDDYGIYMSGIVMYGILFLTLISFPQIIYGFSGFGISPTIPQKNTCEPNMEAQKQSEIIIKIDNTENKALKLFSEEYIENLRLLIEDYLLQKKHLSPECSINDLSDKINIPLHHLSYYFNNNLNLKFTDWRNEQRIIYAIYLIKNGVLSNTTLEAIAGDCGFTNSNTFIRAFKQKTGVTPSAYANELNAIT